MEEPADDFAACFGDLFAVAYSAAFAVLGERGDAEDCAQDTLAKALVRWRRVRHHSTPWVARVATNGAIDRWRRRERSAPVAAPAGLQQTRPVSAPDLSSSMVTVQLRDDLVRVLRALPRRQREAVVLRHIVDLSEADTATALGCSVGSVKSATSRGLAALRVEFGKTMSAPHRASSLRPDAAGE